MAKPRPSSLICQHMDQLVQALAESLTPAISQGQAKSIHVCRVLTRRLKAGMDLFQPLFSDPHHKAICKVLKRIRRSVDELRDMDVMDDHLEPFLAAERYQAAAKWVHHHLRQKRQSFTAETSQKVDTGKLMGQLGSWWALRPELHNATDQIDPLLIHSLDRQWRLFSSLANKLFSDSPGETKASPHVLRISGKSLRYSLELAQAAGKPINALLLRQFKKMQDALGLWHDHIVLTHTIMKLCGKQDLAFVNPQLQLQVLDLALASLRKANRYLQSFGQLWNKQSPAIGQQLAKITGMAVAAQNEPEPATDQTQPPQAP